METEPNGPFAGLVSALGILVILAAMVIVAVLVGVGFNSWPAGIATFMMECMALWVSPIGIED